MRFFEIFFVPLQPKGCETAPARLCRLACPRTAVLAPEISHKYVSIMARPIKETPVLKGEDAFNFEMRRLEVENRTPEERAEARRKFQEQVAEASKHIQWCW